MTRRTEHLKTMPTDALPQRTRAAEYVRMSTEHQRYSIDNQKAFIAAFALLRNIDIIQTYVDAGRSGLTFDRRAGLKTLITDVEGGRANYSTVLVYDVSRWGRFQDTDESAYYEHICKRQNIDVVYCAEEFLNDGSISSAIIKSLKRAMAAEYSRELSSKVTLGQNRLARMGFRMGGPAGFGLRRQLISQEGKVKGLLADGELKSIASDRIVLVPGPAKEQRTVRWLFKRFTTTDATGEGLARVLNDRGETYYRSGPWSGAAVYEVLTNEKYVGNSVLNRTTTKLHTKAKPAAPENWIRVEGCFEPIVSTGVFNAAQRRIEKSRRKNHWSDARLLEALARLYKAKGRLSARLIDTARYLPYHPLIRKRFGSLYNAYRQVGFNPTNQVKSDYDRNKAIKRKVHAELGECLLQHNIKMEAVPFGAMLNHSVSFGTIVRRRLPLIIKSIWLVQYADVRPADLILLVRVVENGEEIKDFILLRREDYADKSLRFGEKLGSSISDKRCESLEEVAKKIAKMLPLH